MEGMPPMSLFEDETGVKLIIIIIIQIHELNLKTMWKLDSILIKS